MLDGTAQKLLRLLQTGSTPEIRSSAALLLGELNLRDKELSTALCQAMHDEDASVRMQAMRTIGQLRVEAALPQLLERVTAGGSEAELAAHVAARLGSKGTQALQGLMGQVAPGLR